MSFLPVIITYCVMMCMFQLNGILRARLKREAKQTGRKGVRAGMVQEFCAEAEEDILVLATSFLSVQVLRFAITGMLPNEEGMEPPDAVLTWKDVGMLCGGGVVFVGLSILMSRLSAVVFKEPEETDEEQEEEESAFELVFMIIMKSLATAFAWCILFGARWAFIRSPFLGVSVTSINGRVMLALTVSFLAYIAVLTLDKIDDNLRSEGGQGAKSAQHTVAAIIDSFSILVGFSWEHSFDGAVMAISEINEAHPEAIHIVLGLCSAAFLLRPWRKYILKRSIQLEDLSITRKEAAEQVRRTCRRSQQALPPGLTERREEKHSLLWNMCG